MSDVTLQQWQEANQRYLTAQLEALRARLERVFCEAAESEEAPAADAWMLDVPPAIETVCECFALTSFERELLLLCAGVELDASIAALCASARGVSERAPLTLGFALAALGDAHWSAVAPSAALRRWYLLELAPQDGLMHGAVRVAERVLHFLAGIDRFDEQLQSVSQRLTAPDVLTAPQRRVADSLVQLWMGERDGGPTPIVQICGAHVGACAFVAVAACATLSVPALRICAQDLPHAAAERAMLARICERDCALSDATLILDCGDIAPGSAAEHAAIAFVGQLSTRIVLLSPMALSALQRPVLRFDIERATGHERLEFWREALGEQAARLNGSVDRLAAHFELDSPSIRAIVNSTAPDSDPELMTRALWGGCRRQARAQLSELAERIEPVARWEDLVLSQPQLDLLREVAVHVRRQALVFEDWGFTDKSARGTGVCALFAGPSGTGKTMAAEVLANDLGLDLYRVDLSRVVSKYIGETEKNLARIFDAGESGGAILLFDEADALFGKRSDVKDSHDRHANIEVSYLLQRMESYRNGIAILTTNMQTALDQAFWRRLRFIVTFQFPDAALRAQIWQRAFPANAPTSNLDVRKLARLNVAGGNIRSIAVNAAFRAAEEGSAIGMQQVLWAARQEYAKSNRMLSESEAGDWQ